MAKEVVKGTEWEWRGIGEGNKGDVHYVLHVGKSDDDVFDTEDEIVTYNKDFSWLGPKEDFIKQFKFIKPAK